MGQKIKNPISVKLSDRHPFRGASYASVYPFYPSHKRNHLVYLTHRNLLNNLGIRLTLQTYKK